MDWTIILHIQLFPNQFVSECNECIINVCVCVRGYRDVSRPPCLIIHERYKACPVSGANPHFRHLAMSCPHPGVTHQYPHGLYSDYTYILVYMYIYVPV